MRYYIYSLRFTSMNRTFHLSPHETICTIALITVRYLYAISDIDLDVMTGLYNMRGDDVKYNPVFVSYALIDRSKST